MNGKKMWLSMLGVLLGALAQAAAPGRELPVLNWEQRSDWINVKTGVTPRAVGDGRADDTAAIQAALKAACESGDRRTVYLPAGTYRITATLSNTRDDVAGLTVLGHGRDTVVKWDGPENGVMFHSNGIHRCRYAGIVWDGAGKAAVAFDHRSQGRYETRIRHANEAFRNVRETGLRVGFQQKMASAEIWIENSLFENCPKAGMEFLAWNDYDNTVSGCGFYNCGTAVNVERGNVYVRDSHFENSAKADFFFCTHSHSIRRCTSLNSYMFVDAPTSSATQEVVIEDCQIDGWKNPRGAIITRMRSTNLIMDTVFRNAPGNGPAIRLDNPRDLNQQLTISNLRFPAGVTPIHRGLNATITEIPAGKLGGALADARQTFVQNVWRIPGKVFDAKVFGAKGDGRADDTAAIEKTIAAARTHGRGAIAYFPMGRYNLNRSIQLGGADYYVGGAGFVTIFNWTGASNRDAVFRIRETDRVVLERLSITCPPDMAKIIHQGTGKPSWIGYDEVYVGRRFIQRSDTPEKVGPLPRGLECIDLGPKDTIFAPHFDGAMKFVRSTTCDNLFNTTYDGLLEVSGAQAKGDRFIAILSRANAGNFYDVAVRDSQNLVISDSYTESTHRLLDLAGKPGDEPGTVFIQWAKAGTYHRDSIRLDNYRGTMFFGSGQFCYTSPEVLQRGANPVHVIFMNNMFWDADPVFKLGKSAELILVENQAGGKLRHAVPNRYTPESLKAAAAALDFSRRIGRRDLRFNYPNVPIPR